MLFLLKIVRWGWKNSNIVWVSVAVFSVGLAYSMWQSSRSSRADLEREQRINQRLLVQIANESDAWLSYQEKITELQSLRLSRATALSAVAEKPDVKPTAHSPVVPILSHALSELRKAGDSSFDVK